jgi:hypothetical protein
MLEETMRDALSITWQSLKDYWDDFVLLVLLNILWSLAVALPLLPLLTLGRTNLLWAVLLSLLLVLPLPIVSGAICFVANQITRGNAVSWGTFATGLRRYWSKSLIVALINLVALILLASNLQFYGVILQGTWTNFALSIWIILGLYWLLVQIFWFPMILELESEKVFTALRNALLMVLVTPGFTLVLAILIVVIVVLSIFLTVPAALLMATLLMLIANHATRSRLAYAQKKPYKPGAPEE